ncbi:MAG: LysR family transcriptional regulator [Rhodocyclaceae bacterium]|nr:LysR family transcriptional regulator [Rhodocyclaceae bacterium]
MTRIPPLPALRAFEATVRLGSIVAAASELHLTHGAVSHQIKALEHLLGLSLFERQGRQLVPTENGRVYALQVRHGLADLAQATQRLHTQVGHDELVIGTMPSFGAHWLIARLPTFMAANPALRISIRAGLALSDPQAEGIDAAIRMGPGGWDGLHAQALFRDRLLVACAPGFRGGQLPSTPAEILDCPLLTSVENWRPWMEAAGIAPREPIGLHFNDSNLLLEALRQGLGVALVRESLAFDALRDGRLVALSSVLADYPTPYWLVWPPQSDGRRKFALFRRWIEDEAERFEQARAAASTRSA